MQQRRIFECCWILRTTSLRMDAQVDLTQSCPRENGELNFEKLCYRCMSPDPGALGGPSPPPMPTGIETYSWSTVSEPGRQAARSLVKISIFGARSSWIKGSPSLWSPINKLRLTGKAPSSDSAVKLYVSKWLYICEEKGHTSRKQNSSASIAECA